MTPNDIVEAASIAASALGSDALSRDQLLEELRSDSRRYLVVRGADQSVEGIGGIRLATDIAEVMTLAAAPGMRRRGVGSVLLTALGDLARRAGADWLWLEVAEDNEPALALYRRAGFEPVGRRDRYYADGRAAVTMRAPLDGEGGRRD